MATVYLGVQHGASGFRKPVAVKRIHPHLVEDRSLRDMFAAEARVVSLVEHPFVCRVEDFGEEGGSPYLVMEYLVGESLHAVFRAIRARSPEHTPSLSIIARIIANLAEALHSVHEATDENGTPLGVVHRDVSPSNLFVLYDGSVRLTDFGIARTRTAIQHTATGVLKGKLSYMSPEQACSGPVDRRADIFALGIVMWEFITNRRFYRAPTDIDALKLAAEAKIPTLAERNVAVPPALEAVLMRCLERDPDKRFQTAHEVAEALEDVMRSELGYPRTAEIAAAMEALFPGELEKKRAIIRRAVSETGESSQPAIELTAHTRPFVRAVPAEIPLPHAPAVEGDEPTHFAMNPRYDDAEATTRRELRLRLEAAEASASRPDIRVSSSVIIPMVLGAFVVLIAWGALSTLSPDVEERASAEGKAHTLQPTSVTRPPGRAGHSSSTMQSPVLTATTGTTAVTPPPVVAPTAPTVMEARQARTPAPVRTPRVREPQPSHGGTSAPPPSTTDGAPQRGQAYVTTRGFSGEVYSGGRMLGRTPLRIDLPVGGHTLTVRHAETGSSQAVRVDIERGRVVFVALGGD